METGTASGPFSSAGEPQHLPPRPLTSRMAPFAASRVVMMAAKKKPTSIPVGGWTWQCVGVV